jgi:hypothetical protein
MEEKKQRVAERKVATATMTAAAMEDKAATKKMILDDAPTTSSSPKAKELKIEVHATAVHHEKLEPIIAHSQSHEISHNQAVNQVVELFFF